MRSSVRRDVLLSILLAWLHRLLFLASNRDRAWGFSIFYEGDSEIFFDYARSILAGVPYDGGVPFHPPGFAVVLAGLHALIGDGAGTPATEVSHLVVKVLLALISSVAVGLVHVIVRAYLGRTTAWVTVLLVTYSFGHAVISVAPVTEGLYTTLLMLALTIWTTRLSHPLAATDEPRRHAPAWGAALGGVVGLMALVRAEAALVGAAMITIGTVGAIGAGRTIDAGGPARAMHAPPRRRLLPWVLALVTAACAIAPWTIRNHTRLDEVNRMLGPRLAEPLPTLVPITIYGPLNLALANHAGADGTFSRSLLATSGGAATLNLRNADHLDAVLHGHERAWAFVRSDPAAFLALVAAKWRLTLDVLRLGWTQWDWPGGLDGIRRPIDMFVPFRAIGMWVSVPLILIGVVGWLRRPGLGRRWALVVLVPTACTMIVVAAFWGYARASAVLVPLWSSALAATLVAVGSRISARWPRAPRARTLAGVVVAAMLVIEAYGATTNRNFDATGTMQLGATHLDPHATMTLRVKRD